ncbi:MAG: efflux RND transporter permease subunit [Bacteroidales bacterium]|nr:efflux RND transporter permease subunit [Bacteroidales bacterium]
MDKIIEFSLKNRLVVLVMAVLLIVGGAYTGANTEVDVFPDLNAPTVVVMTEAEGMAPEEVERLVTFPIETSLNGASDVRRVRSSSSTGFSIVYVEFDWGTDIYQARQIVSEKLAMLGEQLPKNVGQPTLGPQSSILGELLIIGLTSDSCSGQELRTIADWQIRPRLLSTGGVAQVAVMGGDIQEYQILLNPNKMKSLKISTDAVLTALDNFNINAPGGTVYDYGNEYILRGVLSTTDVAEIGASVVQLQESGQPVLLSDIAEVKIGNRFPKLGTASDHGKPAVLLTVTKQPSVSTLDLTADIENALAEISVTLPKSVNISTDIFRQANFIENSISNVKSSLLEGSFFVIIVLFVFLMNWRTTVISLISIPVSVIVALICLKFFGLTVNTMSLGGIAIAIGSLVDDSIVDVENVFKRLKSNAQLPDAERKSVIATVFDASKEVRMPMLNSTLIIVASFLPLFFLSGMEGRMLKPLGITFIISLFASTLVALTLTPVLSSFLLKNIKSSSAENGDTRIVSLLKKVYGKLLSKALEHKKLVLSITALMLIVALVTFFGLGRSFLPSFNEGSFTISMGSLPGISIDESDELGRTAEKLLLEIPEIQTVGRKTGRAELDEHSFGVNTSEFECPYILTDRSRRELTADVRAKLSQIPGVNVEIGSPIAHRIDEMLSGTKANIAIKIFGSDLNKMYRIGNQIKTLVSEMPQIADVSVEQQVERPQIDIKPRRQMLARYGITVSEFAEAIEVLLSGKVVSQVYDGNMNFDVVVKLQGSDRLNLEMLNDILLDCPDGNKVPLSYVADIKSSTGPNTINRENVSRKLVVSCNVAGGELSKTVSEIRNLVNSKVIIPSGYHIEYGGQFESEERASRTIMIVSVFSILLIFILLYGEFKNGIQASTVLLNLPLALIGGVIAVYFSDGILSIPAIIGFISLFGIATRNGMLLIDRYNALMDSGLSAEKAVMEGSLDRLNPILMTAVTSALALIPLALGGDLPGNEIQSPMAKVILGGLISSTLLNAFVIPVMYLIASSRKAPK